ncbi:MAG: PilN domain-containing protein [Planctomycetales bacterium]|nr:PilN domain-containing protein [Planctomycetales bacterium]
MAKKTKNSPAAKRIVAIELLSSELLAVIVEPGAEGKATVKARRTTWRREAATLRSEQGQQEVTDALKKLADEENLRDASIRLALSSDFCVTRVVSGENGVVRQELRRLEERTAWYLTLGVGEKVGTTFTQAIDTKTSLAWMTIVNRQTLSVLQSAAQAAGLKIGLLEHSMIAMCRAVGHAQRDASQPVMLVEIDESGVGLGISHAGRLLLDYRPGGGQRVQHDAAQLVSRQLSRLRRFCERQFTFVRGDIAQVFLCGESSEVQAACRSLQQGSQIAADVLDPRQVKSDWEFDSSYDGDPRYLGALGAALYAQNEAASGDAPDLMNELRKQVRLPLRPMLTRLAAPLAAVVALAILVGGASAWQRMQCSMLDSQLASLEPEQDAVRMMQLEMTDAEQKLTHLKKIAGAVSTPQWQDLLVSVGTSLPEDTWLDTLMVDRDGRVAISGPSHNEDSIYEFVSRLKKAPMLRDVALESTQPISTSSGSATKFDVKARLVLARSETQEENKHEG